MQQRMQDALNSPSPWRTTPPRTIAIFLLAVFFIFASFGFVIDAMNLGRQTPSGLATSVIVIGLFSAFYAVSGLTLRQRFWIAFLPIFGLQSLCMGLLNSWFPSSAPFNQLDQFQLIHLHHRIIFDGVAGMVSISLGYIGFLLVSIAEGRRRLRLQLDKATLEGELAAAREIQQVMVPERLPLLTGYIIENIYQPAAQVGGDFFQVIPLPNGQALVFIGDVSGKGLSAAMVVSMIVGVLRAISYTRMEPKLILSDLNNALFDHANGGFVTCLAVHLDPSGRVTFANAGHLPPWLNGEEIPFSGSMPLGLANSISPEESALEMRPGDSLVLVTDGVIEARDSRGVLFGFERAQSLVHTGASPKALADAASQHGQEDDITVISVLRT